MEAELLLFDENRRSGGNGNGEDPLLGTPTSSQELLHNLMGGDRDYTPSPQQHKVPMSLQKDMRGSHHTTTMTTTNTSNMTTFSSSASKAMSSSKYTSESFQKTFSEFGQIISQRRAELSEMKKANQFRMSNQLRHDLSTPSSDMKSLQGADFSSSPSASSAGRANPLDDRHSSQNGSTPLAEQQQQAEQSAKRLLSPGATSGGAGSRLLARKLILSHQKDNDTDKNPSSSPPSTEGDHDSTPTSSTSTSASSNLLDDIAAEQPAASSSSLPPSPSSSSVFQEMAEQLQGEKQRTAELHDKINELHELEEVQRTRALGLAQDKDKLEALRADLLERNASLELEQQQQLSVLDTRQSRISELERQLAQQGDATIQWKDQYASAEGDRNALQRELASYKSQVSGKEEELISANKELKKEHKKRMSDAEKRVKDRDDSLIVKQNEFDEMSRDNESLRNSLSALEQQCAGAVRSKDKSEQLHKDVSIELQSVEKQFSEMEKANKKLIEDAQQHNQHLQKAQDAVTTHAAMLEDLKTKCAELTTQQQEAETQCSGLAGKLAAKEEACAAQQLQLQALVKADKSKSVTYRTKVVVLLFGIWLLVLAVIYERIVDFQPNTLSPYRITS